jgi:sugar phosphate permease
MGSRLGGAITPLLIGPILVFAGWRASFVIFGTLGVVWSIFWWSWFRDDPGQHPEMSAEELELIREGRSTVKSELSFGKLLNLNLLWICLMYFCYGYCLYFYLTWLPTYLQQARGFSPAITNTVHTLVLLSAAATSVLGGRLTDILSKRFGLRTGRAIGAVSLPLSGLGLTVVALSENNIMAAAALILAAAAGDLCLSACWAMCHDIGKDASGTVTGCMNTFGNLGGSLSPLVVGYALDWWKSWSIPLLMAAGVAVMGGLLTLRIDTRKPLT